MAICRQTGLRRLLSIEYRLVMRYPNYCAYFMIHFVGLFLRENGRGRHAGAERSGVYPGGSDVLCFDLFM